MGYYINPPTGTKEDFLKEFGTPITRDEALKFDFGQDSLPVCLVDNVTFTAAGIAHCPREVEAFMETATKRLTTWFVVSRENLKPYYRELAPVARYR